MAWHFGIGGGGGMSPREGGGGMFPEREKMRERDDDDDDEREREMIKIEGWRKRERKITKRMKEERDIYMRYRKGDKTK